jgi:hypothetical protein
MDRFYLEDGTEISPEAYDPSQYEVVGVEEDAPTEEASWGDILRGSIYSAIPSVTKPIGGALRAFEESPYSQGLPLVGSLSGLLPDGYGQSLADDSDYFRQRIAERVPTEPGSFKDNSLRVGQAISSTVPYLLAPGALPAAGMAGLMAGGESYDRLRDRGADVEESLMGAGADTALSAGTSLLPFSQAFGKYNPVRRVLGTAGANTVANYGQTALSQMLDEGITGEEYDFSPIEAANSTVIPSLFSGLALGAGGEVMARRNASMPDPAEQRVSSIADSLVNEVLPMQDGATPVEETGIPLLQETGGGLNPDGSSATLRASGRNTIPPEGTLTPSDSRIASVPIPSLENTTNLTPSSSQIPSGEKLSLSNEDSIRYEAIVSDKPVLDNLISEVAGDRQWESRVKKIDTVADKIAKKRTKPDYFPEDIVAGRIIVDDLTSLGTVAKKIEASGLVTGSENYFHRPSPYGYEGLHFNVKLPNGVGEIQIHTPESYAAAEAIRASYNKTRRGEPTLQELQRTRAIVQQIKEAALAKKSPAPVKITAPEVDSPIPEAVTTQPKPAKPKPTKPFSDPEKGAVNVGDAQQKITDVFDRMLAPKDAPEDAPIRMSRSDVTEFLDGEAGAPLPKSTKKWMREKLTLPITMAEKFPLFRTAHEAARGKERSQHLGITQDVQGIDKYLNLSDRTKVDEALRAYRRAQAKAGQAIPITMERLMSPDVGLSQSEAEGFLTARNYFDTTGKDKLKLLLQKQAQNKAAKYPGFDLDGRLKEIDEYVESLPAGYVPFSRYGDFVVTGETPNGQITRFYESERQARDAAKSLGKQHGIAFKYGKKQKFSDAYYDFMSGDLADGADLLRENDPDQPDAPVRGFKARLQSARLVEGEDPNLSRSIVDYIVGVNRALAAEDARPQFDAAKRAMIESGETGDLLQFTDQYVTDVMRPQKGKASEILGSLLFHYSLGGNVKSAALNLTQPITVMYPALAAHVKNPAWVTQKAYRKGIEYLTSKNFAKKNPELNSIIESARAEGVVTGKEFEQAFNLRYPKSKVEQFATDFSGAFQQGTETINRVVGLVGGYEAGKAKGLKGEALAKFAKDFTQNVNFGYGQADRPALARKYPSLFIFRLFTGNYLRHFFKAVRGEYSQFGRGGKAADAATTKAIRQISSTMRFAMPMVGLTGAYGLPLTNLIIKAAQSAGYDPKKYLRELMGEDSIADAIEYAAPGIKEIPALAKANKWAFSDTKTREVVETGLPMLADLNLSGSLGLASLSPDLEEGLVPAAGRLVFGAAVDPVQRIGRAATMFYDKQSPRRAVEALLPEFIRNPLKTQRLVDEGGLVSPGGELLADLGEFGKNELTAMALGFNTKTNTRANDRQNAQIVEKQQQAKARERVNSSISKFIIDTGGERAYRDIASTKSLANFARSLSAEEREEFKGLLQKLPMDAQANLNKFVGNSLVPRLMKRYDPELSDLTDLPKAQREEKLPEIRKRFRERLAAKQSLAFSQ